VREDIHVAGLDAASVCSARQQAPDYSQRTLFVQLSPALPAQHCGCVDQHDLPDHRVAAGLAGQFLRMFTSIRARDLLAAEPALTRLHVPSLIVWGTADVFFDRKWAYWLRDTIPGVTGVVELQGVRLLFPDERATEFTAVLRRHWDAH
jgi:pimeloyl-ACP methyl ester carboxylesterase